jgi:glycosyltransferase involved in cell wall biosynthesis
MISVCTPTYNTQPDVLARTWASLKNQTYNDWEWVIWDDSTNQNTWQQIWGLCADERYTIQAHRSLSHSGRIGEVKRQAFMVAKGNILVELDHDDELMPTALEEIQEAFDAGAKFVYSDWCEILPNGQSGKYPDGWAFGYGDHYWDEPNNVWAMAAPPINGTTIRHIVSAPNHVRAWDADLYRSMNGHNATYPVADDYELVVRTALQTDLIKIPKMLYKQHIGSHTAQRTRNALIQTLVAEIAEQYDTALYEKYGPKE